MEAMDHNAPDATLSQKPSKLAERLKAQLQTMDQLRSLNVSQNHMTTKMMSITSTFITMPDQREHALMNPSVRTLSAVPNMGALVHTDLETRMQKMELSKLVDERSLLIYPFEVFVSLELPKPNDFMWDFKHNFFLSIMYSQVYRFFFPFNRHNSQLFFLVNEAKPDEELKCVNVPSRIMFRSMQLGLPLENICVAVVSAYKDYLAFFRLNSKPQACLDSFKNFCYVPPVWTNKLD